VEGGIDEQQLLANFRDDTWSNTCVMLLRFITSAEIKRRVDHFEPFVVVSCACKHQQCLCSVLLHSNMFSSKSVTHSCLLFY
jgi:hypothetical protein